MLHQYGFYLSLCIMRERQQCHKNIPGYSKAVCVGNCYCFTLYMKYDQNTDSDKRTFVIQSCSEYTEKFWQICKLYVVSWQLLCKMVFTCHLRYLRQKRMKTVLENHIVNFPHHPSNEQHKATLETYDYNFDLCFFPSSSR